MRGRVSLTYVIIQTRRQRLTFFYWIFIKFLMYLMTDLRPNMGIKTHGNVTVYSHLCGHGLVHHGQYSAKAGITAEAGI